MKLDKKICKKYGISNTDLIDLQQINIIIGENGAGKTRLLKAINENLIKSSITTVYAYLPDISPHLPTADEENIEKSFYEMFFENDSIDLNDFMYYIEHQGIEFLNEILMDIKNNQKIKNSIRKRRAENIFDYMNDILNTLVHRTIHFENEIYLHSNVYDKDELLNDAVNNMSPGELSLFYLGILIAFIKYGKNDKIALLIDEPEMHLHPKALMSFFDYINNNDMIKYCCMATHSIYLIPLVDFYGIIYLSGGKVQNYTSKLYKEISSTILGDSNAIRDFLMSIETWQYYKFIAECFVLPEPVRKIKSNDEQFLKFQKYISALLSSKRQVDVLDYGAGDGRLYRIMKAVKKENSSLVDNVQYYYYDKYYKKPDDLDCSSFGSIEEITSKKKKFDCIVLMNVLHEIDICDWESTFKEIFSLLKNNGFLLIFEVKCLLEGEQPYGDSGLTYFVIRKMSKILKLKLKIKQICLLLAKKSLPVLITKL